MRQARDACPRRANASVFGRDRGCLICPEMTELSTGCPKPRNGRHRLDHPFGLFLGVECAQLSERPSGLVPRSSCAWARSEARLVAIRNRVEDGAHLVGLMPSTYSAGSAGGVVDLFVEPDSLDGDGQSLSRDEQHFTVVEPLEALLLHEADALGKAIIPSMLWVPASRRCGYPWECTRLPSPCPCPERVVRTSRPGSARARRCQWGR
jgi:hypothetical protein